MNAMFGIDSKRIDELAEQDTGSGRCVMCCVGTKGLDFCLDEDCEPRGALSVGRYVAGDCGVLTGDMRTG